MKFIPDSESDYSEIKSFLNITDVNELYEFPPELKDVEYKTENINKKGLPESELKKEILKKIEKNKFVEYYIGAGIYNHYIPAVVNEIVSRSEFYTSYTPYQPELSQGFLQAMFEFQSLIVRLSGMEVSNASLYDGGTALVEAAYMCKSIKRRKKIVVFDNINPLYLKVLFTYNVADKLDIIVVKTKNGEIDLESLKANLDDEVAGVVVQNPNFFGLFENKIVKLKEIIGDKLLITIFNPISVGLIRSPGEYGTDIAIAEGQSLGIHPNFGGPLLGIIAVKRKYMRRLPGRIVGMTHDKNNNIGFTLTLQAREQHIRRAKATSNICSNEALCALQATVYMSALGENGIRNLSRLLFEKAHSVAAAILKNKIGELKYSENFFNEFVLKFSSKEKRDSFRDFLKKYNILFGLPLEKFIQSNDADSSLLVSVTENNDVEHFIEVINEWKN